MTLQEIENTYGADLAEEIKERIESANGIGIDHKIEVLESNRSCHKIAFATPVSVYLYEVYPESGIVGDRRKISYYDCKKALVLMGEMRKV